MEMSKYVSIKKMAQITGLSEFFIRKMVRNGSIPAIKCGNKYMINIDKSYEILAGLEKKD